MVAPRQARRGGLSDSSDKTSSLDDKKELVPGLEITATTPSAVDMEGMLRRRLPELSMRTLRADTQATMERKDTSRNIILY
jgi:hypothetical protein